jgi:glycosyltransferase involved in cell wall biosynthesis
MNSGLTTINLIQDLATPHNNTIISQFVGNKYVKLNVWYAESQDKKRYQWSNDITNQYFQAKIYGKRLNFSFIRYCLTHPEEKYFIVGWMNINTKILHILFFILQRPFNHWTDNPEKDKKKESKWTINFLRFIFYLMLRKSECKVFAVGKITVATFLKKGFPLQKLVNLPIFVDVDEDLIKYKLKRVKIQAKFNVPNGGYLLSAGSRLIYEKGYDLLINAISKLPAELKEKVKLIIVGSGNQVLRLRQQIDLTNLTDVVEIHEWMDIEDFKTLIANSEIFFHPARFDAYGGTTLAMALSVPVIGSKGAGAAVDRINHGVNGFLYEPEDIQTLSEQIIILLGNDILRNQMAFEAYNTAREWHPSVGAEIIINNSI